MRPLRFVSSALFILVGSACGGVTMQDLVDRNPSAHVVRLCNIPSTISGKVHFIAYKSSTGRYMTDEDELELKLFSYGADYFFEYDRTASALGLAHAPPEWGLTCPKREKFLSSPSEFLPRSVLFVGTVGQGKPAQPSAGSGATSLPRIAVCARPKGITVNEWHGGPGIKGTSTTTNAANYAKETAKATVIYYFDANAPPESVWNFGKDTKLRCPGKAPIPYDQWVAANTGTASQSSGSTNAATAASPTTASTTPKTGSSPPSSTSSPEGQGPPLSTFEAIANNLALAGALAQMDTSGPLNHAQGDRSGIPGGKNVGGFSFPPLQAGVAILQILSSAGLSPKSFVNDILKFAKRGQRTLIKEADAKVMKVADELIQNAGQYEMAKGLQEMQTIMPFELGQKFTATLGGKFQAHKIFEKRAIEDVLKLKGKALEDAVKKAPSIILTDAEHTKISNALAAAWKANPTMSKEELRAIYKIVYREHPEWLDAIASYFR